MESMAEIIDAIAGLFISLDITKLLLLVCAFLVAFAVWVRIKRGPESDGKPMIDNFECLAPSLVEHIHELRRSNDLAMRGQVEIRTEQTETRVKLAELAATIRALAENR